MNSIVDEFEMEIGLVTSEESSLLPHLSNPSHDPCHQLLFAEFAVGYDYMLPGCITCVSMKPADPQKLKARNHKFLQQKLVSRGLSIWRARGITGKDSLRPPYSRPNLTLFPGIFNDQKRKPLSWHLPSALWVKYPAVLRPNSQTPIILPSPDTHIFYFLSFIPLHHSFCA